MGGIVGWRPYESKKMKLDAAEYVRSISEAKRDINHQ